MKKTIEHEDQELFFGIVSPVGTENKKVVDSLKTNLSNIGYKYKEIKLSGFLEKLTGLDDELSNANEYERINSRMTKGNSFRLKTEEGGILALACISKIHEIRKQEHGDENKPIPRIAYIINSLKHEDEVKKLRQTYGQSFWLISAYSPFDERKKVLTQTIRETRYDSNVESAANRLLERDQEENIDYGQSVSKTFPLGDVFIDTKLDTLDHSMKRFIKMIFNYPNHSPTIDEYGMFLAQASAYMSASLARQVGASILTERGEIMSTGTNEVPNKEGGVCSEDHDNEKREWAIGYDANIKERDFILGDFLRTLQEQGWLSDDKQGDIKELVQKAMLDSKLKNVKLMDLTEFGREVHAEMTALIEASRKSISIKNCFLYCTTFPCHVCAKHIITAGIQKVFYIEPYPKSMAEKLFSEFISIDKKTSQELIEFNPFVGIAPRRFMEIFKWGKRKDDSGNKIEWDQSNPHPRFGDDTIAIKTKEHNEIIILIEKMKEKKLEWS